MLADTGQLAGMTALFDSRMRERMRGANAAGSAEVQPSKVFIAPGTFHRVRFPQTFSAHAARTKK